MSEIKKLYHNPFLEPLRELRDKQQESYEVNMKLALEFGFRAAEKGWDWEMTQVEFERARRGEDVGVD